MKACKPAGARQVLDRAWIDAIYAKNPDFECAALVSAPPTVQSSTDDQNEAVKKSDQLLKFNNFAN